MAIRVLSVTYGEGAISMRPIGAIEDVLETATIVEAQVHPATVFELGIVAVSHEDGFVEDVLHVIASTYESGRTLISEVYVKECVRLRWVHEMMSCRDSDGFS
ncbi:hypothetical protein quinque_008863 [Culex quinquefasciatus]